MNVLFKPTHVKFAGENTRRESIPNSCCATEERTILEMSRAMSHRIDMETMSGPGKTRLPIKCSQRWHEITNFTRAFTVKISVKQRQASHVSSMAQGRERAGNLIVPIRVKTGNCAHLRLCFY